MAETEKTEATEETGSNDEAVIANIAARLDGKEPEAKQETETEETPDPAPTADSTDDAEASAEESEPDELDDLVYRAIEAGMSDEELDSHLTVESLREAVSVAEARKRAVADSDTDAGDDAKPSAQGGEEVPDFGLDDEFLDPDELVGRVKEMKDYFASQITDLTEQLADARQKIQEQEADASARRVDGFIADLDKPERRLFGDGYTADLDSKSDEFKNRRTLREEMETLRAGYEARKKAVPEDRVLFKKALVSAFGDELDKIEANRKRSQVAAARRKMTMKPTTRQGQPMSATERAFKVLSDGLAEIPAN